MSLETLEVRFDDLSKEFEKVRQHVHKIANEVNGPLMFTKMSLDVLSEIKEDMKEAREDTKEFKRCHIELEKRLIVVEERIKPLDEMKRATEDWKVNKKAFAILGGVLASALAIFEALAHTVFGK